jgi:hypothetical protein
MLNACHWLQFKFSSDQIGLNFLRDGMKYILLFVNLFFGELIFFFQEIVTKISLMHVKLSVISFRVHSFSLADNLTT